MTPKKPVNKVDGLLSARREIDKKIEKIQSKCKHPTKSIKQIQERLDFTIMVIRYVCDECLLSIGYPTQQEIKKYLNG